MALMRTRTALISVAVTLFVVCGAPAACVFWAADPLNFRAPSDEQLMAIFNDHRDAFERLRQMTIGHHQKEEYINLLSGISGLEDMYIDYDASARFIFASGGLSAISGGWLKGIQYVPGSYKTKGEIVENLDNARALPAGVHLREIKPGWFIVYQKIDD